MKKLLVKQIESFVGGEICNEMPLQTELQMLMCLVRAEEQTDVPDVFIPYGPGDANFWQYMMFM